MFRFWWEIIEAAGRAATLSIGQSATGILYLAFATIIEAWLNWHRKGFAAMKERILRIARDAVVVGVLAWIPFFLWHLIRIPYSHSQEQSKAVLHLWDQNAKLDRQNADLKKQNDRLTAKLSENIAAKAGSSPTKFVSPVVGAGATINQDSSGATNSPNVIGGSVTINPDINPNQLIRTYNCAGISREVGPTAEAGLSVSVGGEQNIKIYNDMVYASKAKDWAKLLDLCTVQKDAKPEWLSPYLFCAIAHLGLGDKEKARVDMEYYDKRTGPQYDADEHCANLAAYIHSRLQ